MQTVYLKKSNKAGKKFMVIIENKTIHFGAEGMSDYTIHKDKNRMYRYISRHEKNENWKKSGIKTAGFWSRWLLWNKPSFIESKKNIEKNFNIKIFFDKNNKSADFNIKKNKKKYFLNRNNNILINKMSTLKLTKTELRKCTVDELTKLCKARGVSLEKPTKQNCLTALLPLAKSPAKKAKSPAKKASKSKSPAKKAKSPAKKASKSKSPAKKAKSPAKKASKSKSPAKKASKSKSPTKKASKSKSPAKRGRPPGKAKSPAKKAKSKSPAKRGRPPGKAKSPAKKAKSPTAMRMSKKNVRMCKELLSR
jgi:hypothetical protein